MDADLEREYSPSSRAGGSADPFVADWQRRSRAAEAALGERLRVLPDGSRFVVGEPDGPVLVFVHGGYWQALSAADSSYLAPAALALGWSFAAVEYTIAPEGTLEQMVSEVRAGLASTVAAVREGGVTGPVIVAGHSAGAHLVAMATLVEPPPVEVRCAVLVSGVYDLRPLLRTTVNDALGLDAARAAMLSPALLPLGGGVPRVVVTWGDHDTESFAQQSRDFARRIAAAELEVVGRHHFDIVDDLVQQGRELHDAVLRCCA